MAAGRDGRGSAGAHGRGQGSGGAGAGGGEAACEEEDAEARAAGEADQATHSQRDFKLLLDISHVLIAAEWLHAAGVGCGGRPGGHSEADSLRAQRGGGGGGPLERDERGGGAGVPELPERPDHVAGIRRRVRLATADAALCWHPPPASVGVPA